MFNKQLKKNIEMVDEHISKLMIDLTTATSEEETGRIQSELDNVTELRCKLSESKVSESHSREIISGLIGIAGIVLVLKHEKADIITTKAFSMVPKLFRG